MKQPIQMLILMDISTYIKLGAKVRISQIIWTTKQENVQLYRLQICRKHHTWQRATWCNEHRTR